MRLHSLTWSLIVITRYNFMSIEIPAGENFYPKAPLKPLIESESYELQHLAEIINNSLPGIEAELFKYGLRERGAENLCIIATSLIHKALKDAGFTSKIIEGDVLLAPQHSLEHRINIVEFTKYWVLIDLTVSQLPHHYNEKILIKVLEPDARKLKQPLKEELSWWFADST